jgi:hypothetical protein
MATSFTSLYLLDLLDSYALIQLILAFPLKISACLFYGLLVGCLDFNGH